CYSRPVLVKRMLQTGGNHCSLVVTTPSAAGVVTTKEQWLPPVFLILSFLLLSSCGYRLAGKQLAAGRGLTIAVPTFNNRTTGYRIEQKLTEAVRRELIRRTRFSVQPEDAGDVVLTGEVSNITLSPVIFNQQGRGSSYTIILDLKVN